MDDLTIIKDCEVENLKEEVLHSRKKVIILDTIANEINNLNMDNIKNLLRKAGYTVV